MRSTVIIALFAALSGCAAAVEATQQPENEQCSAPAIERPSPYELSDAAMTVRLAEGEGAHEVLLAEDLSGDSVADLVVAVGTASEWGSVRLYTGDLSSDIASTDPWHVLDSVNPGEPIGAALAFVKDFSGRGDALVVGDGDQSYYIFDAPLSDADTLESAAGVLHGDLGTRQLLNARAPGLAAAPDLDGDGLSDFLVGASSVGELRAGGEPYGAVLVVHGPLDGWHHVDDLPDRVDGSPDFLNIAGGVSAAVAPGDLDGDGYQDLAISGDVDIGTTSDHELVDATWVLPGPVTGRVSLAQTVARVLGAGTVAAPGDVDADGNLDLVLTATAPDSLRAAWIMRGPFAGNIPVENGNAIAPFDPDKGYLDGVVPAGDVDGDGFPDLLFTDYGSWGDPGFDEYSHTALAWGPLCSDSARQERVVRFLPEVTHPRAHDASSGGVDVDGDSRPEIVVTAVGENVGTAIYLLRAADL